MSQSLHQQSGVQQLQAGVNALSEGFALFDENEELIFCNEALARLYPDLSSFLVPGMPWSVFLVEARRRHDGAELEQLDAHLSTGLDAPLTLEACRRGKQWVRMGIHPVDGGGFVLTEADTTDEHQAHEIIEHADDLLRDILDACASRIVLSRVSDGRILYRTPAWKQTFGETHTLQQSFEQSAYYMDLLADLLSTKRIDDHDSTLIRFDGDTFPARISARIIDYQGEAAMVASTEDMSQLYLQRDEIIRINRRMLDAIEALDQGFVLFDSEHRLLLGNQRYMEVNKPIRDALTPGNSNAAIMEVCKSVGHESLAAGWPQSESDSITARYEFTLAQDNTYAASRRATSDGGFVIAWRDVTAQRKTEKELNHRREEAFQNEKLTALGQLLAGVAHELNNPLSVVLGHAMMLRDEVEDAEALDSVDKISRSAERCAKIVKTFLAMARQKPAQLERINMNDIVERALEIASFSMNKRGINIKLQLDDKLPDVLIDEDQLAQVFINLMINAEHALAETQDAPVVKISTCHDADTNQVITRISDNGPGVPDHIHSRIFEPFFTTKAIDEGTGVGLALSHRIISSHNGRLDLVQSELGGATFSVSLPSTDMTKPIATRDIPTSSTGSLRVLLVEDEPDVAGVLSKLLSGMGADSVIAANAEQGISILETDNMFDLILSDLRMPGLSGRSFLQKIESRWPELSQRFVFVTGDAISEDAEAIRRLATHRLMEKPVSPTELQALINSLTHSTVTGINQESSP